VQIMEVDSNLVEEFKHLNKENVEFRKKCAQLAQEITSGQLSIVKLVEELGALLVDVSPSNRELGTWVLTHVLEGLPAKHFDKKQLDFICAFYIDRLKDHHQVVPAVLVGVLALAKFNHFPDGAASQILSAIFQNVACQQQQERDRNNIYKIFEVLLDKCETELCAVGLDYVCGIISAVDGERNPRNLVLLFNWFPKFLKTVNLGHLTEETFEILACYFPVDFKAPTQDPNPITRETLADSLAPCLTAIPQFAEFCFSLALEKLDSSLEIAKLDSLKLLEMGCLTFDNTSYVQHSTEIWSQIQKELFNTPAPVVEAACLSTLVAVIKKISLDSSLNSTVKDISDTLKGNLLPDSRLFEPSAKILLNAAKASHTSCTIISKEIVPILINTFNITTTATHKVALLNVLINFFESSVKLYKLEFDELNKIPILCLKASVDENDSLRKIGFDGLRQISQFLSIDLRYSVYDNLQKLLLIPQTNDVRNSILNCLDELAKNYPNEVKEKLIGVGEITNVQTLEAYLDALSVIVIQGFFTNTVVDILFEYLRKNVSLGQTAVNSLKNILLKHDGDENVLSVLIERGTISTLVDWFLSEEDNLGAESVESVAFILKSIIGNQSSDRQREILFKEFPKVDLIKSVRIFVLDGLLCRLRRDVQIDYKILDDLMALIRTKNNDFVKNVAVQLLSNLLNKCDENTLQNYLTRYESNNDITTMSWITKALVMRNHEKANLWTDKVFIELILIQIIYLTVVVGNITG
jgi:DNA repair/transcription protein MET18/MMS19